MDKMMGYRKDVSDIDLLKIKINRIKTVGNISDMLKHTYFSFFQGTGKGKGKGKGKFTQ
jgi:hypothetical protein